MGRYGIIVVRDKLGAKHSGGLGAFRTKLTSLPTNQDDLSFHFPQTGSRAFAILHDPMDGVPEMYAQAILEGGAACI